MRLRYASGYHAKTLDQRPSSSPDEEPTPEESTPEEPTVEPATNES